MSLLSLSKELIVFMLRHIADSCIYSVVNQENNTFFNLMTFSTYIFLSLHSLKDLTRFDYRIGQDLTRIDRQWGYVGTFITFDTKLCHNPYYVPGEGWLGASFD